MDGDSPQATNTNGSQYHKTLVRQIRKYLGDNPQINTDFTELLKAVSATYTHADDDRALIERSLEISSRELSENYQRVKQQVDAQTHELRQRTREAEESHKTLQTILDSLPVGVMVAKVPSGEPLLMNKLGTTILGDLSQPIAGIDEYNKAFNLKREDGSPYPNEDLPLTKTLHTGRPYTANDIVVNRPDGTVISVRAFAAPIIQTDGAFTTAVVVFEDITAERNLEHTRDEFFAIASHELRTPLTAIRGNASMMLEYYADAIQQPDVKDMIHDIHESSVRLIAIVNDFLDMSRLEQHRMKFEITSFDVVALAESVVEEYEAASTMQGVPLMLMRPSSALPEVYADQNRVKQVLINLVGNALKFTKQGSVSISFVPEHSRVKVLVSDTGDGMTEDAKQKLFHKFEQTGPDPLTRDSVHGTGLGLYISKLLMRYMDGDIQLESSEVGKGTVFSFSIPTRAQDGSEPVTSAN